MKRAKGKSAKPAVVGKEPRDTGGASRRNSNTSGRNGNPSPWLGPAPALAAFAVYFYTAAPGITTLDSGEFAMVTRTLDIGHPPGVPTYVLLGHLFTLLPVGAEIARRTNLFSSCCAALTVWFVYLLIRELFRDLDPRMSAAGALAFGFSLSLWHWGVVTEVYALNILLVTITYWLAARGHWMRAALMAGLALGVHHATVAMTFPAVAFLLWNRRRPGVGDLLRSTVAGAAGLSVYLYLPIRAAQTPALNWGDPQTLEKFWWHLTGRQYSALFLTPGPRLSGRIGDFLWLWAIQMAPAGCLFVAIGLVVMFRKHRQMFCFTALGIFFNLAFIWINNLGGYDLAGYYMPVFLTSAWCFALGADSAVKWLAPRRPLWAMTVVFVLAIAPLAVHFETNDRRNDRVAPLFLENTMRGVPPNSLILTSDWEVFSPWLYSRFVEGVRPDIVVVQTQLLRTTWYLDHLQRAFPEMTRAAAPELAEYRHVLDAYVRHRRNADAAMLPAYLALIDKFITVKKAEGAGVFHTLQLEPLVEPKETVVPRGLLYSYAEGAEDVDLDFSGLLGDVALDEVSVEIRKNYSAMLTARAIYASRLDDPATARRKLDMAMRLDPNNAQAQRLRSALP